MPLTDSHPNALAQIYAQSLYELADAAGGRSTVEECLSELEDILELSRENPKFSEFLSSRTLAVSDREASIGRIFKGRISDLTLRFMLTLNKKGRLTILPAITAAFDRIVQTKFGRVEIDVFTAQPLDAGPLTDLQGKLSRKMGKDVILHPYTEPSMIGGVKFRIGDELIDASIRTRLRAMKDQINKKGGAALRARIERTLEG